jgi:hypothetical protein
MRKLISISLALAFSALAQRVAYGMEKPSAAEEQYKSCKDQCPSLEGLAASMLFGSLEVGAAINRVACLQKCLTTYKLEKKQELRENSRSSSQATPIARDRYGSNLGAGGFANLLFGPLNGPGGPGS